MLLTSTLHALDRAGLRKLLIGSFAAHLAANVALAPAELAMRRANGKGIVALELAGSGARATELFSTWGIEGRRAARRSLRGDFFYMATYGLLAAAAVEWASRRITADGVMARLGPAMEGAVAVAVVGDAIEGVALLTALRRFAALPEGGQLADGCPTTARRAATVKFAALAAVAGFVAGAGYAGTRPGGSS